MLQKWQQLSNKNFSWKKFDYILAACVFALNLIGIAAIFSADSTLGRNQLIGMIFGMLIMFLICRTDSPRIIRKFDGWPLYILTVLLLLAVLLFGSTAGGAQRWISLGIITFQPSEMAKLLLILFYAEFIIKIRKRMTNYIILPLCVLLAVPPVVLILREPDLSTSIVILLILAVILFLTGLDWKIIGGIIAVGIPAFLIFLYLALHRGLSILNEYQRNRILAWIHPENYADTTAYQTMNSMMAIGSGGLIGKGFRPSAAESMLRTGFISESETDFIFAVIGEELGFIGCCAVVILLTVVAMRCYRIAAGAKDFSGRIIAAGVGTWIGAQGFINIGVATGMLPNTGIPLPFVSYGLTSLICLYAGMGFVLSVRMQNVRADKNAQK